MPHGPSMLSLAAAVLYLLVSSSCILAATTAIRGRQMRWHGRNWALLAVLFVAFAALRIFGFEEVWREDWRIAMRFEGTYEERRSFQRPIVAALIAIGASLALWWVYRVARVIRGRRNIATMVATSCAAVMVFVLALRLVSLHPIDSLLYGPIKLNWIMDVGSSLAVLGSALYYWRIVSARP